MLKRNLRIVLLALVALLCSPQLVQADDVEWVNVGTAEELKAAIDANDSANIYLTADIDLSTLDQSGVAIFPGTFSGKIYSSIVKDGDNATPIYALKNAKNTIFEELDGATFRYLRIEDCSFVGKDDKSGQLADSATLCQFIEIAMANIQGRGYGVANYKCDCMGGLVGSAKKCNFNGVRAANVDLEADGSQVGVIVGRDGGSTFVTCFTNLLCSVMAGGNSLLTGSAALAFDTPMHIGASSGGICGYSGQTEYQQCQSMTLVTSIYGCIGGIAGFAIESKFNDSQSIGCVVPVQSLDEYHKLRDFFTQANAREVVGNMGSDLTANMVSASCDTGIKNYMGSSSSAVRTIEFFNYSGSEDYAITKLLRKGAGLVFGNTLRGLLAENKEEPDNVGGIVGYACLKSRISACASGAYVRGNAYVGGIAGSLFSWLDYVSSVVDCLNIGVVSGHEKCGGIVGCNDASSISTCLNVSYVLTDMSATTFGNIQGEATNDGTCSDCCYSSYEDGTGSSENPVSQQSLASGHVAIFLNSIAGNGDWKQTVGTDFYPIPKGITVTTDNTANTIHDVTSLYELQGALVNPAVQVRLNADIDLNGSTLFVSNSHTPFCGVLDGNSHKLSGILIDKATSDDHCAIFPAATHATFKNLELCDATVRNIHTDKSGLLVGASSNDTFENISVTGQSTVSAYANQIGFLAGYADADKFVNCTIGEKTEVRSDYEEKDGTVSTKSCLGGLVGECTNGTRFDYCWNAGLVWSEGNSKYGGIVGQATNSDIWECLNSGYVVGKTTYDNTTSQAGGIVGVQLNGQTVRCTNTGNVNATVAGDQAKQTGGIVGLLQLTDDGDDATDARVKLCFNFGDVTSKEVGDGRIYGVNEGGLLTDCAARCKVNDAQATDLMFEASTADLNLNDLSSGKFAYELNTYLNTGHTLAQDVFFQSIDNGVSTIAFPNPIHSMGAVYKDVLCDASNTVSYSNLFQSDGAHDMQYHKGGICAICGRSLNGYYKGDINDDGNVNIEDVTLLIQVLDGDATGVARCKVDDDDNIDLADLNALVQMVLSKQRVWVSLGD